MTNSTSIHMVCHKHLEGLQLWPKSKNGRHTQKYNFSLNPPRKGVDRIQAPDYSKFELGRKRSLQICHYKSEKSFTPYRVEKTSTDIFRSALDIHLQQPCLHTKDQGCTDSTGIVRSGYCKRSLHIKH